MKQIIDNGFAYESNGSIYFDIAKYNEKYHYGILSGRNLDDVINASRQLDGVGEKRNQADFALWKKAQPEHIMRWPSPWSDGSQDGTASVRPWDASISATTSTYTAEAWTSCSRIMSAR